MKDHNIKIPKYVENALKILESYNHEAYLVGGCIRDSLLNIEPNDWDICTSAFPKEICEVFNFYGYKTIDTGLKHGTVTVIMKDNQKFYNLEITTYRTDGEYEDNRHPKQVRFVKSLKQDLARRDFTINALAYNPKTGLVDCFGGQRDIEDKIIQAVGNPNERIREDALRILRGLRFSSKYGFEIESSLSLYIHKYSRLLKRISVERIQNEFNGILMGKYSFKVLSKYRDIISEFIPEIRDMFGFEQNNPYHHLDVWEHTLLSVEEAKTDLVIKLSMFFHDIGKPSTYTEDKVQNTHFFGHAARSVEITETVLKRLKYPNEIISEVLTLIEYHNSYMTEKNIIKLMRELGDKKTGMLIDVINADIKAQNPKYKGDWDNELTALRRRYEKITEENLCYRISDLNINGNDLIDLGLSGKAIGETLEKILDKVILDDIPNQHDELVKCAKLLVE